MSAYQRFIFENYEFNKAAKSLHLYYSYGGLIQFSETYNFDFDFAAYDNAVLDQAIQMLFFMAGVSYYKAYLPTELFINKGQINATLAKFLDKTYQKGLGEFFYVNKLSPHFPINFPINSNSKSEFNIQNNSGLLIGIGGGKDSLVTAEALRNEAKVSTWSLGHRPQLTKLIDKIGLRHYWVERTWDRSLLEHNAKGALNGHVPISAILACVGLVVAILSGNSDVVVSNESSANEPTLEYGGTQINHQYSKSQEFEKDFQLLLNSFFGSNFKYYSFIRPLSELRVSEIFAKKYFDKYSGVFSSCNKAFVHSSSSIFWCGVCAKCAFTFLALTPFLNRHKLEKLFGGKNLLLDPALDHTYKNLLGIAGDKPLECVGEIKESRAAMRLAQEQYPELNKYKFEIPAGYDYSSIGAHTMPDNEYQQLLSLLKETA